MNKETEAMRDEPRDYFAPKTITHTSEENGHITISTYVHIAEYDAVVKERDEVREIYGSRLNEVCSERDLAQKLENALLMERDLLKSQAEELAKALEIYAMTDEAFPEYGDVAREALAKYREGK